MFLSDVNNGRRRRVRFAYPQPLVDLVLALVPTCGVAAVAKVADIPESVVYRWRAIRKNGDGDSSIEELLDRCVGLSPQYARLIELTRSAVSQQAARNTEKHAAINRSRTSNLLSPPSDCLRIEKPARPIAPSVFIHADAKRRLHLAKTYIEDHYNEALNSVVLGRIACMSRTYFIRLFGEEFGVTPHQYLMRIRLKAARHLLKNSQESIDVIAAGVGFRSGANLGRAFKRIDGRNISQIHTFTASSRFAASSPQSD